MNKTDLNYLRSRLDTFSTLPSYIAALHACGIRPNTKQPARQHSKKALYFAVCGDAIKIGVSIDPEARLQTLQTGTPGPLRLIATLPKMGSRESECHQRLSHLALGGEWFRYTEEIDQLIKELSNE